MQYILLLVPEQVTGLLCAMKELVVWKFTWILQVRYLVVTVPYKNWLTLKVLW